ncbi:MAG: hypothetical protein M3495_07295 [Pseudomonadota bacterium]|nr:hypothetical protein [Pseudomonadota bacterium]
MVDRVLDGYIRESATDFGFVNTPIALQFEHLVNYLLVKRTYPGILDPEQLSTGNAAGIDGIAIFVNDRLVTSQEDVDFFKHAHVRLRFVFVQSKTTPNFDMGDMGKFLYAVEDFFRSSPLIPVHEGISEYRTLQQYIFATLTTCAAPAIELYYVTTGAWQDDPTLRGFIDNSIDRLKSLDLSAEVVFEPIGGHKIKGVYRAYKKSIDRTILLGAVLLKRRADGQAAFRKSWLAIRERWLRVCSWAL